MIPIVAIVGAFGTVIGRLWMRHRERMALIEMGIHPDYPPSDGEEEDSVELEPSRSRESLRRLP